MGQIVGGGKEKGKTGGVPGTSYMYRYGFCTVRQYSGVYGWGGVGTATVVGRTKSSATCHIVTLNSGPNFYEHETLADGHTFRGHFQ